MDFGSFLKWLWPNIVLGELIFGHLVLVGTTFAIYVGSGDGDHRGDAHRLRDAALFFFGFLAATAVIGIVVSVVVSLAQNSLAL